MRRSGGGFNFNRFTDLRRPVLKRRAPRKWDDRINEPGNVQVDGDAKEHTPENPRASRREIARTALMCEFAGVPQILFNGADRGMGNAAVAPLG